MKRDTDAVRPDLRTQAWTLGPDNAADLAWAYANDSGQPPVAWGLDQLPVQAPWERKRQLWMVFGAPHPGTIAQLLERITPCSQVVCIDAQVAGSVRLDPSQMQQWQDLLRRGRLKLIVGGELSQRSDALAALIDINDIDGWKPVFPQALFDEEPVAVRDLLRMVSASLTVRVMLKSTKINMGARFLRNALLNAPLTPPPQQLDARAGELSNRPALIVSAGPSLNKQLPLLAKHQDLFTIIAVDTVWPILQSHGITPDYLVALDPITPPSWPQDGLSPHTRFVVDVVASPTMAWSQDRGHLFTSSQGQIGQLLRFLGAEAGDLSVGGSVATQAFNLAVHLGANPIVLIGQDLALTGGRDHADGYLYTYDDSTLQDRRDTGYDVDGYYGGTVRTERQLLVYKTWFEARIGELPDRMVINATEGGARIAGSLQLPFAQVCEQIGLTSLRKPVHPPATPLPQSAEHLARLRQQLGVLQTSVADLRKLAEEAEALTGKPARNNTAAQLKKIDRINTKIKNFEPHAKLLTDACSASKMEAIRHGAASQKSKDATLDQALAKYRHVYQGLQEACDVSADFLTRLDGFYAAVQASGRPDPALLESFLK